MTRIYSQYYMPRTKAELIKSILPVWNGRKADLRAYSVKRLTAIFHRVRQEQIGKLMSGKTN